MLKNTYKKIISLILSTLLILIVFSGSASAAVTFSHTIGEGMFNLPQDVAIDSNGDVYVSDFGNKIIREFSIDGTHVRDIGAGSLNYVHGITIDSNDNIIATNYWGGQVVIFNPSGSVVATIDGFSYPADVAVDSSGNLFVADSNRWHVKKYDSSYNFITSFGNIPSPDGPLRVAVDNQDNVYVSDSPNHRIQKFTNSGEFITAFGSYGTGDGQFNRPWGTAIASDGTLYITDFYNNRVQILSSDGTFLEEFGGFNQPSGVVLGTNGEIIIADTYNNRVQVFTQGEAPQTTTPAPTTTAPPTTTPAPTTTTPPTTTPAPTTTTPPTTTPAPTTPTPTYYPPPTTTPPPIDGSTNPGYYVLTQSDMGPEYFVYQSYYADLETLYELSEWEDYKAIKESGFIDSYTVDFVSYTDASYEEVDRIIENTIERYNTKSDITKRIKKVRTEAAVYDEVSFPMGGGKFGDESLFISLMDGTTESLYIYFGLENYLVYLTVTDESEDVELQDLYSHAKIVEDRISNDEQIIPPTTSIQTETTSPSTGSFQRDRTSRRTTEDLDTELERQRRENDERLRRELEQRSNSACGPTFVTALALIPLLAIKRRIQ
jgi:sugar lactone lactonase YvrE